MISRRNVAEGDSSFAHGELAPDAQGLSPIEQAFDVIVVGGGAAGIGAALGARQALPEARILVVESEGCLGGAATHRGVLSYCGLYSVEPKPRRAVGAIWTEIHSRLVEEGAAAEVPDKIAAHVQVMSRQCYTHHSVRSLIQCLPECGSRGSEASLGRCALVE